MEERCNWLLETCLTIDECLLPINHEKTASMAHSRLQSVPAAVLRNAVLPGRFLGEPGDHVHIGAHGDAVRAKFGDGKPARLQGIVARDRLAATV